MSINPTTSATINSPTGVMTKEPKTATNIEASPEGSVTSAVVPSTTKTVRHKVREHLGFTVLTTLLVASVAITFAALDSNIERLGSNIGRLDSRIDRLEDKIDKRFDVQDAKFEAIDKRFEAQDEKFDKRFEAQDEKFDKRFEAQDEKLEEINVKLTALIATLNATTGIEAAIDGRLLTPDSTSDSTPAPKAFQS